MPILRRYDSGRPVAHMHVPKSAGTSLHNGLIEALRPTRTVVGLGRHHFGRFTGFGSFPEPAASMLLLTPESMRDDAEYVGGHIAFGDIQRRYGDAQFVTVAREPYCRTISQWLFWRAWPWGDRGFWGEWGRTIDHSRLSLAAFLSEPEAAPVTDNAFARLLIGDDPALPLDAFIGAGNADHLLQRALSNLRQFSLVGYVEAPSLGAELSEWLNVDFRLARENQTPPIEAALCGDLSSELTGETLTLLRERNAIDLRLWSQVVEWSGADWRDVRTDALCRALPRFSNLYSDRAQSLR